VASFRGSAVLPDDCVVDRFAGLAIPDDGGLALIGDAHGGQVAGTNAGLSQDLDHGAHLRGQDVVRVVFYPATLWVNLAEFAMRLGDDVAVFAEQDGTRTRGSLVEREDKRHGAL
jgi:hypothetical protein